MYGLTDVHCHILPYVDDGAENLDEALAMLRLQAEQGVAVVFVTPHLRKGMFTSTPEKVEAQLVRLQQQAEADPTLPAVFLGRECYCDSDLKALLKSGTVQPYSGTSCVLIEFSPHHPFEMLQSYVALTRDAGYRPVIAHAERYECLRRDTAPLKTLIEQGALIQVNADSILGREGFRTKLLCRKWMKENLVYLVGSDAHHTEFRGPHLGDAAAYIEKKMGAPYAQRLLLDNPRQLLKLEALSGR